MKTILSAAFLLSAGFVCRAERPMSQQASGTFEVKVVPQPDGGHAVSRFTLDKQFAGQLTGESLGEMISAGDPKTSAGYVAIERVTGSLNGKKGSFVLMHSGIMNRGVPSLTVSVIPDSGTAELTGIAGTLTIRIEGGKHFYDFTYTLPA